MLALILATALAHGANAADYRVVEPSTGRVGGAVAGVVLGAVAGAAVGAGAAIVTGSIVGAAEDARCRASSAPCTDAMEGGQAMLRVGTIAIPLAAFAGAGVGGLVGAGFVDDDEPARAREHLY